MTTTDAVVLDRHGGPDVLERRTIALADPGPREVQVRIRAVALNHLDLWVRRGGPAFKLDYPHRLGSDIAGEVAALGVGVTGIAVGQRVVLQPGLSCTRCEACLGGRDNLCRGYRILGESTHGGYAQHLNVPDVNVVPLDENIDLVEAAAFPLTALTAWQMVHRKGEVKAGHHVVVNAAGSGVSTMIIQLCRQAGARVIATTTSPAKVRKARELGASDVIVSSEQDLAKEVKRLTGRRGADIIFDHVGGELFERSLDAVRWGGRVVICGATAGFTPRIDLRAVFFKQIEIRGSTMGSKADLLQAIPMLRDGRLRPIIDRVMPLWEAPAAHEALESRTVFGKVVLAVD